MTDDDPTAKIFISYRRADSADVTGRIYDRLAQHFGAAAVFRDVHDIPPGDNFKRRLEIALAQCDVELVVIGPGWLDATDDEGQRRLDILDDFVRIEVERGLDRDILVIPLLVSGAAMPSADQLPTSLAKLADLQAMPVRPDIDFHRDMDRLIQLLDNYVPSLPVGPETLANAEQRLAELPALQARMEHVAEEAVKLFSYWRFWNLRSIGLDDQQLLFDWLKDKGVDDVKRDFRVLYETINMLREEGLEVEHILKSEFDAVIREHDNPSKL